MQIVRKVGVGRLIAKYNPDRKKYVRAVSSPRAQGLVHMLYECLEQGHLAKGPIGAVYYHLEEVRNYGIILRSISNNLYLGIWLAEAKHPVEMWAKANGILSKTYPMEAYIELRSWEANGYTPARQPGDVQLIYLIYQLAALSYPVLFAGA